MNKTVLRFLFIQLIPLHGNVVLLLKRGLVQTIAAISLLTSMDYLSFQQI